MSPPGLDLALGHPGYAGNMTTPPGMAARALCAAADEALTEASFLTADFTEAERLFTEARESAAGTATARARRSRSPDSA